MHELVIPVRFNEAAEPLDGARRLDEGRDIVVPHVVDAAVRIRAIAENGCEVGDPLVRCRAPEARRLGDDVSGLVFPIICFQRFSQPRLSHGLGLPGPGNLPGPK